MVSNRAAGVWGRVSVAAMAVMCCVPGVLASGVLGEPLVLYRPSDSVAMQRFGADVAVDGGLVAVGADRDRGQDSMAGAVYLLDLSDPRRPVEVGKVHSDVDLHDYRFGASVALREGMLLVGASARGQSGMIPGAASLYDVSQPGAPVALHGFSGDVQDDRDWFGHRVALAEGVAIVSAPRSADGSRRGGAVFLFDTDSGMLRSVIRPSSLEEGDDFGHALGVSGAHLLIGAPGTRDAADGQAGMVYVYDISDPASPVEVDRLRPDTELDTRMFGHAIAVSGSTALISALGAGILHAQGAVYVYDLDPLARRSVIVPDMWSAREFGDSIGIDGDLALVSSPNSCEQRFDSFADLFVLYDLADPGAPVAVDVFECDRCGRGLRQPVSVAVRGDRVLLGMPGAFTANGLASGGKLVVYDQSVEACVADWNRDGTVDVRDLLSFLDDLASGDAAADLNGDGEVDVRDFFLFLEYFDAGC